MYMIRMSMRLFSKTNKWRERSMKKTILTILGIIIAVIVVFYFYLFLTA